VHSAAATPSAFAAFIAPTHDTTRFLVGLWVNGYTPTVDADAVCGAYISEMPRLGRRSVRSARRGRHHSLLGSLVWS
jgi:hypothetical protein